MTDILLRELTNSDLDWLITHSEKRSLQAAEILLYPYQVTEHLFILISGQLALRSQQSASVLTTITRGEMVGEDPLFQLQSDTQIQAVTDSVVLAISYTELMHKMQHEPCFASHLYRAIAIVLSERLRSLFESPERLQFQYNQSVKEALFVFGELRDSDIDWLMQTGTVTSLMVNKVLLQAGRPVDALHIILDGRLSIATPDGSTDPLILCFMGLEESSKSYRVFAEISKGGLPGISSFLDARPLPVTIRAVTTTRVLSIPRPQLMAKLQQDVSFAARFYRVIAVQIATLLQTVIHQVGQQADQNQTALTEARPTDRINQPDQTAMDEDELNLADLEQISQGAARFDWMLSQLEARI